MVWRKGRVGTVSVCSTKFDSSCSMCNSSDSVLFRCSDGSLLCNCHNLWSCDITCVASEVNSFEANKSDGWKKMVQAEQGQELIAIAIQFCCITIKCCSLKIERLDVVLILGQRPPVYVWDFFLQQFNLQSISFVQTLREIIYPLHRTFNWGQAFDFLLISF